MSDSGEAIKTAADGDAIGRLLSQYGIAPETIDSATRRYPAVPVSAQFNKQRTHVLLRKAASGCCAYVDCDLDYRGTDAAVQLALTGPCRRKWRRLRLPPLAGTFPDAFYQVAELLGSPLAAELKQLRERDQTAAELERPAAEKMLGRFAEVITPDAAAAMFQSSFRRQLAMDLAMLTNRPTLPRSAVLWGRPGSGRDHLMLAAAHPLIESGRVKKVYRLPGARIASGCMFSSEIDAALQAVLAEASSRQDTLLIVQNLDVCVSRSPVSFPILADGLDRGLRMLATVWDTDFLRTLRLEEALARRIVAVHVPAPSHSEVAEAVKQLAADSAFDVAPAAIQASIHAADKQQMAQPAAALSQLGAAVAASGWEGQTKVCPDDVLTVLQHEWPE